MNLASGRKSEIDQLSVRHWLDVEIVLLVFTVDVALEISMSQQLMPHELKLVHLTVVHRVRDELVFVVVHQVILHEYLVELNHIIVEIFRALKH